MILNYTYVNQNNQSVINPDESDKSLLTNTLSSPLPTQLPRPLNRKIKFGDRSSRPVNRIDFQTEHQPDFRTISLFEKAADNMNRYDFNGQLKSASRLMFLDPRNNNNNMNINKQPQAVTLLPQKNPNRTIILIPKPKLADSFRLPPQAKIHPSIKNDLIRRSRSFTVNPRDRNRIINYIVNNQNVQNIQNAQNFTNQLLNTTLPTVLDEKSELVSTTDQNLDETTTIDLNESVFNSTTTDVSSKTLTNGEVQAQQQQKLPPPPPPPTNYALNSSLIFNNNINNNKFLKQYINLNDENNLNTYYYNNSDLINKMNKSESNTSQMNLNSANIINNIIPNNILPNNISNQTVNNNIMTTSMPNNTVSVTNNVPNNNVSTSMSTNETNEEQVQKLLTISKVNDSKTLDKSLVVLESSINPQTVKNGTVS